jgi:glycosyltransferase involved in cell wall biosynthesis
MKRVIVNIGCFGAIRPMKNHFEQAIAAIKFANKEQKYLQFHINGDRLEQQGENVLRNLRALFRVAQHTLVEHKWRPHEKFIGVIRKMDIGLQVSLSESFNIVTADFVSQGVPIVVSHDIDWMPHPFKASPVNSDEIADRLSWAWHHWDHTFDQTCKHALHNYNEDSAKAWERYFHNSEL